MPIYLSYLSPGLLLRHLRQNYVCHKHAMQSDFRSREVLQQSGEAGDGEAIMLLMEGSAGSRSQYSGTKKPPVRKAAGG